jgi:ribose/xylose/arabinose/galactoside ABC-type transport system permease subunit
MSVLRDAASRAFKRPEIVSVVMCVLTAALLAATSPHFFNPYNIESLVASVSPEGIVGLGMLLLLITGVFDLSVGSVMCLGGLVAAMALTAGVSTPLSVFLGLASGVLVGLVNGLLSEKAGVNPLITTLGTMYIVRSITELIIVKQGQTGYSNLPASFTALGQGRLWGVHYMFWIMIVLAIVFTVGITMTPWGRRLYFIGGNEQAAVAMGMNKKLIRISLYVLVGVLAALAGILVDARAGAATRYIGQKSHMNVIVACAIGGGSLMGGKGNMIGALFGTLFLSLLSNAFNLYEINQQIQTLTLGAVLIAVVTVDGYLQIRKRRMLGKE